MEDDKQAEIKRKMQTQVEKPLVDAEQLIMTYFGNGDAEGEIAAWIARKGYSPADARGIAALDILLASSQYDQELVRLVVWVANHPLDVPDPQHARAWLKAKREWLGDLLGY